MSKGLRPTDGVCDSARSRATPTQQILPEGAGGVHDRPQKPAFRFLRSWWPTVSVHQIRFTDDLDTGGAGWVVSSPFLSGSKTLNSHSSTMSEYGRPARSATAAIRSLCSGVSSICAGSMAKTIRYHSACQSERKIAQRTFLWFLAVRLCPWSTLRISCAKNPR